MKKAVSIKTDPHNYRLHPEANKRIIRKNLEDLGAGRSIVTDSVRALELTRGTRWGEQAPEALSND